MSTHALGAGTRNLSVNVRVSLHRALGRMAFLCDLSMGALVRELLTRAGKLWVCARRAQLAAAEDRMALQILRKAGANGYGPEDAAAIEHAMRLIADSERNDRRVSGVMRFEKEAA